MSPFITFSSHKFRKLIRSKGIEVLFMKMHCYNS
uniref:Uncharacterized protein n=1 Tax=Arundo donax TaxID=35708 RepID=A0A0A8YNK3_ARUDO